MSFFFRSVTSFFIIISQVSFVYIYEFVDCCLIIFHDNPANRFTINISCCNHLDAIQLVSSVFFNYIGCLNFLDNLANRLCLFSCFKKLNTTRPIYKSSTEAFSVKFCSRRFNYYKISSH